RSKASCRGVNSSLPRTLSFPRARSRAASLAARRHSSPGFDAVAGLGRRATSLHRLLVADGFIRSSQEMVG
ncbi:hypothetical protein EJB05_29918, partial [Eragrostis curvula]